MDSWTNSCCSLCEDDPRNMQPLRVQLHANCQNSEEPSGLLHGGTRVPFPWEAKRSHAKIHMETSC